MLKNKIKNKYKIKNKFYNYFIKNESNNNIIEIKLNLGHPFEEWFDDFIDMTTFRSRMLSNERHSDPNNKIHTFFQFYFILPFFISIVIGLIN